MKRPTGPAIMQRAEILATHTPALFQSAVRRASAALREGEVVALPTETVYGLAANALDATAVQRIFAVKGRPAHNPVIVHISDLPMARRCAAHWPILADKLAVAFWPGPLTLVLPRSPEIPDAVTAGGDTVGIRWPSHPIMQAVIRECGFPLAAPSANRANEVSPTNAGHVARSLGERISLIVDGGQSQIGIESAVLDLTVSPPRLLRPGMIHEESLVAVIGALATGNGSAPGALRSPGMLRKHYSPKARLIVASWPSETGFEAEVKRFCTAGAKPVPAERVAVIAHTRIPVSAAVGSVRVIPHDAEAFARAIYSELHCCDESGAELIIVESLPAGPEWRAIDDRLQRAAAKD
jgi:L-threonylcarbamoyladenylate synthase